MCAHVLNKLYDTYKKNLLYLGYIIIVSIFINFTYQALYYTTVNVLYIQIFVHLSTDMFQHITTEIHNNEIIFFGRQENKKSIAVRIQNYKPHRIIKCSAPLAAVSAVLKKAVN